MIPEFRTDGYLPEGSHSASEAEVTFRFGSTTPRRRRLVLRLRRWIVLAKEVGARRLLMMGVSSPPNPSLTTSMLSSCFRSISQFKLNEAMNPR
jgi:hypothetical protein